jgi:hypothetical protein
MQRLDRQHTGVAVVFFVATADMRFIAQNKLSRKDCLIFSTLGVFTNACPGFIPEDRPQSKAYIGQEPESKAVSSF